MTDVISFIDALSPRELSGQLEAQHQGNMDSGVPRVTPRVMSSIYTGQKPSENGMLNISRMGGEDTTRPYTSTFIDQCVREGMSVVSMGMPFCIPFQAANPTSVLHGGALAGEEQYAPEQAQELLHNNPPMKEMIGDDPEAVYGSFRDHTISYYTQFKEVLRQVEPDIAFIGYRLIDSYCHFQHTEQYNAKSYRENLIEVVDNLLTQVDELISGDVMWFSDHGQTELTETFRVNRWLKEKGYLDYKVDYDFIDTLERYQPGEQHPVDVRVENQFTFGRPGVQLNQENSQVVCSDSFDSCLTLLEDPDDFDAEAFRDDLLGTGAYRSVDYRWEKYDESDEFYETVPHVLTDRDKGVFVSGNLHKNPVGMGWYRTGVHDRTACFGSTRQLNIPQGEIFPEDMYNIITDFIGLEITSSPIPKDQLRTLGPQEQDVLQSDVKDIIH